MSGPRILIAGVGNIFLGDDAFGVEVARRLMQQPLPENIRVKDYGIRGMDLAYDLVEGVDVLMLLDATPRGQAPGTLMLIEVPWPLESSSTNTPAGGHNVDPLSVLRTTASLGSQLKRVLVLGCEPQNIGDDTEIQDSLSKPVQRALPEAVRMVEEWIQTLTADSESCF